MQVPPAPTTPASTGPAAGQAAKVPEFIKIAESLPYVSKGGTVQHYVDYLNLKSGQDKLNLTMTFSNGGFTWITVSVAGTALLTHAKVAGKATLPVSLVGNVSPGSSQVLIEGMGARGATLKWTVTAPMPTLKLAKPAKDLAGGDKLTLTGTNFCTDPKLNLVAIGKSTAEVTKATDTTLEVTVPDDIESGKQKVFVTVVGTKVGPLEVTTSSPPELMSLSLMSGAPGTELTITGKNFAKNPSENQVLFGETPGTVVGGDRGSLSVIIPEMEQDPQYDVPISVRVGKMKSKNTLDIMIQQRVF